MSSRILFLAFVALLTQTCDSSPAYNMSMDGSGDEAELELIFPTSSSTRRPAAGADITAATGAPSLASTITTTMIRLKDFVLSRVVDFLQEHLLIIIVVTSLLVVMVFIICCASAMSHKRKLEAYKAPPATRGAADKAATAGFRGRKNSGELQDRPYAVDHVKRVQTQTAAASPKNLRTPSKALVGDKGRDAKPAPRHDARKTDEDEKPRDQPKPREEAQRSPGPGPSSAQPTCTCHLKKSHH